MVREEIPLKDHRFEATVRVLAASVNVKIFQFLVEARREEPHDGWRFLSEIALGVEEAPGTVGVAIQKLLPLVEERRHKGRRYFRARARLHLVSEPF